MAGLVPVVCVVSCRVVRTPSGTGVRLGREPGREVLAPVRHGESSASARCPRPEAGTAAVPSATATARDRVRDEASEVCLTPQGLDEWRRGGRDGQGGRLLPLIGTQVLRRQVMQGRNLGVGDAEDELRSDWRSGAGPTREQGQAAAEARQLIAQAKAALDRAAR